MTVGVGAASNMAAERPAGSHSLATAAHCQRSPHWRGVMEQPIVIPYVGSVR